MDDTNESIPRLICKALALISFLFIAVVILLLFTGPRTSTAVLNTIVMIIIFSAILLGCASYLKKRRRERRTGYLNGLLSSGFKKNKEGKTLFYPNGIFGRGYLINEETEKQVRDFLKKYYSIFFIVTIILISFLKPFIAFFSLIFWLPYYRLKINKILSGAEKTNERLTFSGNFKNIALNTGLRVNIILLILTLLMVTMSILTLSTAKNKIISILAVLFFGVASASFFFSTRICLKYRGK